MLVVTTMEGVYSKSLPSFIKPCKRKDPNLSKCLQANFQALLKKAEKGLPDFKIPVMEPFVIPKVQLDQGSSKAITLKSTFTNLAISGLTKGQFTDLKVTLNPDPNMEVSVHIPSARIISDYEIDGKLLVVPIKGSGKCEANLTEVTGSLKLNAKYVEKKGSTFFEIVKRNLKVNAKGAHFYFDNLFQGNKELGETTNKFINENWRELYKELEPVIEKTMLSVMDYFLNLLLQDYSYDDLLPEK